MQTIKFILPALLVLSVAACSPATHSSDEKTSSDSTVVHPASKIDTALTTQISFAPVVAQASPIEMTFTVYNNTDSSRTFCKWHTPFEPLMSKYLDIKNVNGEEADYQGPMAKRIMPPPADSYITIKPGDSLTTKVDLRKAYNIKSTGKFNVSYNAANISGLTVTDSVSFLIK